MKFFVPFARDDQDAENILASIARFNGVPVPVRRIFRLSFHHHGKDYIAEIGKPAPSYYQTGDTPIVAILEGSPLCICLANRGVLTGSPILASRESVRAVEYFDE